MLFHICVYDIKRDEAATTAGSNNSAFKASLSISILHRICPPALPWLFSQMQARIHPQWLTNMKYLIKKQLCFLSCVLLYSMSMAQEVKTDKLQPKTRVCAGQCCCAASYTPIGIMTDHLHPKGDWAFSYSMMQMSMKGNLSGTQNLNAEALLANYLMAPSRMTMQMHMLMGMYGLSHKLTLMGMLNYTRNDMSMDMVPMDRMMMNMPGMNMSMNMPSTCRSSGLGDTKLWALYQLFRSGKQRIVVATGLSIPTGSTAVTGTTLLGENTRLPYMMQLGTGTWDLLPAVTYTGSHNRLFWGANLEGSLPLGTNSRGYAWGPQVKSSAWLSYKCLSWAAASIRAEGTVSGRINGYDQEIAVLSSNDASTDASHTGGQRVQLYLGLHIKPLETILPGAIVQVEFGLPVYQNLNGPQMRLQNTVQAACMYAF
jgi:hypothetical protein